MIYQAYLDDVSIHAPTKGATCGRRIVFYWLSSFNPRTHKGCDLFMPTPLRSNACFNPRTHKGCDQACGLFTSSASVSIHAPTKGATKQLRIYELPTTFQSTHPQRVRRCLHFVLFYIVSVSIHAPTKGATRRARVPGTWNARFNPRTHKGCD